MKPFLLLLIEACVFVSHTSAVNFMEVYFYFRLLLDVAA